MKSFNEIRNEKLIKVKKTILKSFIKKLIPNAKEDEINCFIKNIPLILEEKF